MFCAVRAGAPRRIFRSASALVSGAGLGCALGGWFTVPPVGAPLAAGAALAGLAAGCTAGAGVAAGAVGAAAGAGAAAAAWAAGWLEEGAAAAVPRLGASGVLLSDTASGRGASAGPVFTGFASPVLSPLKLSLSK